MRQTRGFTLVELMIAIALGLVLLAGIVTVLIAQRQVYGTASAQASIQNTENAIAAMVTPSIRSAGFAGCGAFSHTGTIINTSSTPLPYNFTAPVFGFEASGSGFGGSVTLASLDAANDGNTGDWSPALDATLGGLTEKGSDVIAVAGELPGTIPVATTNNAGNSAQLTIQMQPFLPPSKATVQPGMIGAVSDCSKSIAFVIFSQSGANASTLVVHHDQGSGTGSNKQAQFTPNFPTDAQFVLMQQEVFYVGQSAGGQSGLYGAVMMCGSWQSLSALTTGCSKGSGGKNAASTPQPLVPGVDNMQILYGIGPGGVTQQWVPASLVNDWTQVNAVRMGFLVEGAIGSAAYGSNPTAWDVLGTTVNVPRDTRLRHVYVMTISIRNATL